MTRQGIILSIMLSLLCVFSWTRLYQQNKNIASDQFKKFPQRIGEWQTIAEFPPSPKEVELLETTNIIGRHYRDDKGRQVTMALVYDPSGNRKMAHPQEICLTAGGMDTVSKKDIAIGDSGLNAERLVVQKGTDRQLYYYWYKAGPYQSGNYLNSQVRLALGSVTGQQGGTALIRISSQVTVANESEREQALQDFARQVMPEMERFLP
jgi:EpsI family protein